MFVLSYEISRDVQATILNKPTEYHEKFYGHTFPYKYLDKLPFPAKIRNTSPNLAVVFLSAYLFKHERTINQEILDFSQESILI